MKPFILCVGLLLSNPCFGKANCNLVPTGEIAFGDCLIAQYADVAGTRSVLAAMDNQALELPGGDRLNPIVPTRGGRIHRQPWIYDGTRDESLYFENGHIG